MICPIWSRLYIKSQLIWTLWSLPSFYVLWQCYHERIIAICDSKQDQCPINSPTHAPCLNDMRGQNELRIPRDWWRILNDLFNFKTPSSLITLKRQNWFYLKFALISTASYNRGHRSSYIHFYVCNWPEKIKTIISNINKQRGISGFTIDPTSIRYWGYCATISNHHPGKKSSRHSKYPLIWLCTGYSNSTYQNKAQILNFRRPRTAENRT